MARTVRNRKLIAAAKAVARARKTLGSSRRSSGLAPARTGGFFGVRRRQMMGERKVVDVDPGTIAVTTTGTVTLINGVATGTDFTDRVGRKIVMKSVFVRGIVFPDDVITLNSLARIMLVYDMQANGAAPIITDILKSATAVANLNLNNRDRFKILMDKEFAVAKTDNTATQAVSGSPTCHRFKKYTRLNHEVLFNGTTAAVGSIATGALYLVTIGTQAAGDAASVTIATRIRFEDA